RAGHAAWRLPAASETAVAGAGPPERARPSMTGHQGAPEVAERDSCCYPSCLPLPEPERRLRPAITGTPVPIPDTLSYDLLLAQFDATVLSPGFLAGTGNGRLLFTVGDQLQLRRGYALQNQVTLNGSRTTLTQRHVVFAGATLVGVTFQRNTVALGFQVLGMNVQRAHRFGLQLGAVELEVEGGDCAQSSFFTAGTAGISAGSGGAAAVARVRIHRASTCRVTAFGGTTNHNAESDNQSCHFAELDNFHHRLLINPKWFSIGIPYGRYGDHDGTRRSVNFVGISDRARPLVETSISTPRPC